VLAISPLTADLLPAAVELDRLCLGGLWTLDGYQRELDSPNSDLLGLVSCSTEAPPSLIGIACLWAILEEAHITLLAVHPDYRRQGLGKVLFYALLESAWRRGLERATLEVRASNQTALSLYAQFDFREVGRRRRYYPDDEDAAILWRKGLNDPEFPQTLAIWRQAIEQQVRSGGWEVSFAMLGVNAMISRWH
jgi:[ribosomal protein S18]-alanine N-acetyltransferase